MNFRKFLPRKKTLAEKDTRTIAGPDHRIFTIYICLLSDCNVTETQVAGHRDLLEGDPYLRQRLRLRDSYTTALNVCQAYTLKRIRDPSFHSNPGPHLSKEIMEPRKPAAELVKLNTTSEYAPGLEDTLILTMKESLPGCRTPAEVQTRFRCVM